VGVTYKTNTLAEGVTGGKSKQDSDCRLEVFHEADLPISIPILVECMRLLVENVKYRFGRVAGFENGSERVSGKVGPGLLGIVI
jgi:hypothetical protein